jgi:hypothetical protein
VGGCSGCTFLPSPFHLPPLPWPFPPSPSLYYLPRSPSLPPSTSPVKCVRLPSFLPPLQPAQLSQPSQPAYHTLSPNHLIIILPSSHPLTTTINQLRRRAPSPSISSPPFSLFHARSNQTHIPRHHTRHPHPSATPPAYILLFPRIVSINQLLIHLVRPIPSTLSTTCTTAALITTKLRLCNDLDTS